MDDSSSTLAIITSVLILMLVGVSLAISQIYLASRPSPFDRVALVSTMRWAQHRSFPAADRLDAYLFP